MVDKSSTLTVTDFNPINSNSIESSYSGTGIEDMIDNPDTIPESVTSLYGGKENTLKVLKAIHLLNAMIAEVDANELVDSNELIKLSNQEKDRAIKFLNDNLDNKKELLAHKEMLTKVLGTSGAITQLLAGASMLLAFPLGTIIGASMIASAVMNIVSNFADLSEDAQKGLFGASMALSLVTAPFGGGAALSRVTDTAKYATQITKTVQVTENASTFFAAAEGIGAGVYSAQESEIQDAITFAHHERDMAESEKEYNSTDSDRILRDMNKNNDDQSEILNLMKEMLATYSNALSQDLKIR